MSGRHAGTHPAPGTPIAVSFGPGTGKRRAESAPLAGVPLQSRITRNTGVHAPLIQPSNQRGAVR